MMTFNHLQRTLVSEIIRKALEEAINNAASMSYMEIWADALGQIMSIKDPEIARNWYKEGWEFQREVGKNVWCSFEQFMNDVARIESSVSIGLSE